MPQLGSKKSRRGCNRCKQRRVKCNEQAPCDNCVRRHEECSLLEPTPSIRSETNIEPALPSTSDEWIDDLNLMHHYSSYAFKEGFGARREVEHLWQDYIPQQAMKHTFLMHGLLALSALHLAYLNPSSSSKYLQLCDKHQAIALQKFRAILSSNIDPSLADALFALSSTISVSAMARSCAVAPASNHSKAMDMDEVAELIFLTRGVRDVIHTSYTYIKEGPMGMMFEGHAYPEGIKIDLPTSVTHQFDAINQMLTTYGLDSTALVHCQSALEDLVEIYKNVVYWRSTGDLTTGHVWRWTTMISTSFVRLIQARNSLALVVFAYYAAVTTAVPLAWYTQNWGDYAVRGVAQELDEHMQQWIVWPAEQVQQRMAVLEFTQPLKHSTQASPSETGKGP